jgi:hypothetical protein
VVKQQGSRAAKSRDFGGNLSAITLGVLVKLKSGLAIALFAPFPHTFPALLGVFTVLE